MPKLRPTSLIQLRTILRETGGIGYLYEFPPDWVNELTEAEQLQLVDCGCERMLAERSRFEQVLRKTLRRADSQDHPSHMIKLAIAQNPKSAEILLVELVEFQKVGARTVDRKLEEIRIAVAENPSSPPSLLNQMLHRLAHTDSSLEYVLFQRGYRIGTYDEWVRSNNGGIRRLLAKEPGTPRNLLERLAIDSDREVRSAARERLEQGKRLEQGNRATGSPDCFIVTACYGARSNEVEEWRRYRDSILLRTPSGRLFVRAYYTVSPSVADWISRYACVRLGMRQILRLCRWILRVRNVH